MPDTRQNLDAEQRANELYWSSDESVNQIADDLDLSKGTLYGLIRPLPTGLACPDCGEEVLFANRTARDRKMVSCALCGWEGEDDDADPFGSDGGVTLPTSSHGGGGSLVESDRADPPGRLEGTRQRTIVGGALLGAAAGLAFVLWTKRR